jgi:hypothetical protein
MESRIIWDLERNVDKYVLCDCRVTTYNKIWFSVPVILNLLVFILVIMAGSPEILYLIFTLTLKQFNVCCLI